MWKQFARLQVETQNQKNPGHSFKYTCMQMDIIRCSLICVQENLAFLKCQTLLKPEKALIKYDIMPPYFYI